MREGKWAWASAALCFDNSILAAETETFCVLDYSLQRLHAESEMWTRSRCVRVCLSSSLLHFAHSYFSKWRRPPRLVGYLTNGCYIGYLPTHWRFLCSPPPAPPQPPPPLPPPPLSPHQHSPVDVSRVTILPVSMTTTCCCPPLICPSLPPFLFLHSLSLSLVSPFSLTLSCLPSLCTLLVFQGQRGSQPDSEIETRDRGGKWEKESE